jgi:hypothetical protein
LNHNISAEEVAQRLRLADQNKDDFIEDQNGWTNGDI